MTLYVEPGPSRQGMTLMTMSYDIDYDTHMARYVFTGGYAVCPHYRLTIPTYRNKQSSGDAHVHQAQS